MDLADIDLVDATLHATTDLGPVWRALRADRPLWWHAARAGVPGFWVLTRHADVLAVPRDSRFTSTGGNMLGTLLGGGDAGAGRMVVVSDGAWHAGLRRLVRSGFGPRVLDVVTSTVEAATRDVLGAALARGVCDFVPDVAALVPLTAICELLGVPRRDRREVLELTNAAMLSGDGARRDVRARIAQTEILRYYARLAVQRRAAPGADVVSLLATGEVNGRPLTDDEVLLNCYNLIIGGDETARLAIGGGLLALIENPDQWEILRADATAVDTAVEEMLRWTSPVSHVGRTALADVPLHGRTIHRGDVVTLWLGSANRDERVFAAPDRFDVRRSPNQHVTFGHGHHFCVGARLARVELRTVVDALRRNVTAMELVGPVTRLPSNFVSGISSLPVALTGNVRE
jgi:cytochrome P450